MIAGVQQREREIYSEVFPFEEAQIADGEQ
jgi:hypothetical protein